MRLSLRAALPLLGAGLLAGCSDAPLSLSERTALAEAEERWAARGFTDYSFEYVEAADLSPSERVRIRVQGSRVVAVERLDGGVPRPGERLERWPTIEGLFAQLHRAQRTEEWRGYDVRVAFDRALGFPRSVAFEPPEDVLDGYFAYTVAAVAPQAARAAVGTR